MPQVDEENSKPEKLDKKDLAIIEVLKNNSRETQQKIAKEVALSNDAIGYRIKRMEKTCNQSLLRAKRTEEEKKAKQIQDTIKHQEERAKRTEEEKKAIQEKNTRKRIEKRENIEVRKHEKELDLLNDKKHLKEYQEGINDTLTNICNSCLGFWF